MPKDKEIGGAYRFRYTDYGEPPAYPLYAAHRGQVVTIVRKLRPDESKNLMYEIEAADGWTGNALAEELIKVPVRHPKVTQRLKATHHFTYDRSSRVRGVPVTETATGRLLFITLRNGGKIGRIWKLDRTMSDRFVRPIKPPQPTHAHAI